MLTVDDGHADRLEVCEEGEALLRERGVGFIPQYREGHAAEVILALADEEKCDLIALGAYGHSEFLEILFGSTVDDVMRKAAQAILICR
jgi:nucleotide-binding universal stress UspA family protein